MKHFTLSLKWLFLCLCLTAGSQAWGQTTTYKLEQVTTVGGMVAGQKYVFEQDGYVMKNTFSSSALQTTNSYKTTALTGTEQYIWNITAKTGGGYYLQNVNWSATEYLINTSSTTVAKGSKSSVWNITFDEGKALIQESSNNRFLGYTSSTSYAYKAYAESNLSSSSYPHDIRVYKLVEETALTANDLTITSASSVSLTITAGNPSPTSTVTYTSSSTGALTWNTSDADVATVSAGVITAVGAGTCDITVSQAATASYAASDTKTIHVTVTDNSRVASDLALTGAPVALSFDLYDDSDPKVINYTTSSTGAVTIADNDYATFTINTAAKTITVTPKTSVTPSAQTITVNQAQDASYNAGSVTFTISIEDNTPYVQPTNFDINLNNTLFGTSYSGSVSGITDGNPVSGSSDNVTVTYAGSGNHYINDSQIRFYPSNKLTFEAPSGYIIKQIVFTADGTWAATISATPGTYTLATKTWTGKATSVVFTGSESSRCDMSLAAITLALSVAAPTFSVAEGEYSSAQNVVMSCATDGAVIYYTTDGTKPNSTSSVYSSAVPITETTTLKAIAIADEIESAVTTAVYTINRPVAPAFDVPEGAFDAAFDLHLTTETDGATIYYTTDGSNPTNASTAYSTKIAIPAATTTIKAIAVKNGLTSDVASATYTYDARETPTFALSSTAVNAKVDIASNVTVTTNYDGTITATSSDPTHMPVSYNAGTKTCTFTADQAGTYTITFSATGSVNYKDAGGTVTVTVTTPQAMEVAVTTNYTWLGVSNTGSLSSFPKDINCSGITATISGEGTKTRGDTDYIRLYAKNTLKLTAPTGYHVIKVVFSHKSGSNTVTASEGTWTSSTHTWTGSAEDVTFTIGGTSGNNQINGFTVTLGELANVTSVGVGTWASDSPLDFTDATIKAYYATVEGSTLTFHEINKVPANTGVLLVKAGGATEAIPTFTDDADATTGNVFVPGTGAAVNYDAGGGYYNYVLFNGEDGIGFYQANNNTIAVNRAYVHVGGGLSVKSFSLNFDDETGISLTPAPSPEGEGRDAAWYDMTGRRVAQPTKGIYIHGGKKVMIK